MTIDLVEPEVSIVLSDQLEVADASMVRFETIVTDPSVELQMEITLIELGEYEIAGEWVVNTPGAVEQIDLPGYYGLWLVDVRQLSGPAGVFFDTTATVVRNSGAPLALSPSTVSADAPTVTASWSSLEAGKTHLATVDWGSPEQRSIVEVRTGPPAPRNIVTTTAARLSSSINIGIGPTYLITRVSANSEYQILGQLRLRVDGVIRSTTEVYAYSGRVFRLQVPTLPPGLHRVQAEFRPSVPTVDPSNSPTRRLLVAR